jgi:hypothetical protein
MTPGPLTALNRDVGIRTHSIYDLEVTLVAFIKRLISGSRLDNPTVNLAQPDIVTYDPTERAQSLELKVSPRVERGDIPRIVTGEINVDKLPNVPAILVQATKGKVESKSTLITVHILISAYDESPGGNAYQDCQNILDVLTTALTTFGQAAIDHAYPIVLPMEWELMKGELFPHAAAQLTTVWELPSARPGPDDFVGLPSESISIKMGQLE